MVSTKYFEFNLRQKYSTTIPNLSIEKFAEMVCNDDPNNPEILPCKDNIAWEKALVRCTIQMILRFLQRIKELEKNEDLINRSVSVVSKREFYVTFAEEMTSFRKREGDTSDAVIWKTYPYRRYGKQYVDGAWKMIYCVLRVGRSIPVPTTNRFQAVVTMNQGPSTQKKTRAVRTSMKVLTSEQKKLENVKNEFNRQGGPRMSGKLGVMKILVIKQMLYLKKYYERNDQKKNGGKKVIHRDMNFFCTLHRKKYKINESTDMDDFFWKKNGFLNFLKATCRNAGSLLNESLKDPIPELTEAVMFNYHNWDFSKYNLMSIYDNHDLEGTPEFQEVDNLIQTSTDAGKINAAAISYKIFTLEFADNLCDQFESYKAEALAMAEQGLAMGNKKPDEPVADLEELERQQQPPVKRRRINKNRRIPTII